MIESKKYFYSCQQTHYKTVDNMSRACDLFIDRTQDQTEQFDFLDLYKTRTKLVHNMYYRSSYFELIDGKINWSD